MLGAVFLRAGGAGLAESSPVHDSPNAAATWLSSKCWGAYLAILTDPDGHGLHAFCDPSGLLPVYRAASDHHVLLSSDPRLFAEAGLGAPAINWTMLRAHLCRPELRSAATCLSGVRELTPGTLSDVTGRETPDIAIWRPDTFLPGEKFQDFAEAAASLRSTAQATAGAWAELAGPVAVAASGGVDSSLICAALASGGHRFDCITLATSDPSGDERRFVRTLADHFGVRMVASHYDAAHFELARPASAGMARPARRSFVQALDRALDDGRTQLGAASIFDGNGGDNLFCFVHSAAPVVDRMRVEGFWSALPTLLDMCAVTQCDIPGMIRAVVRRYWRQANSGSWQPDLRLLEPAPGDDRMPEALTPWHAAAVGLHGGKLDHLALIMCAQNHIHGLCGTAVPRFSPLMSQPLVELCLSFPTWLWCRGGINRALARAAFADVLPSAVLRRTSKAGPDSFIRSLFAAKRERLRDMLVEGHLAEQGLIDRSAIAAAMATDVFSADAIAYRLLDLGEAEAWARSWIG